MFNLLNRIEDRLLLIALRTVNQIIFKRYCPNQAVTFNMKRVEENVRKYGYIECRLGKRTIKVPLENEFGKCYPCYATDVIHQLFPIRDDDLVVDVGGGNNPLKRANVVIDLFPGETTHRAGKLEIYPHQEFIQADVQDLRAIFQNKSIDFLFTQQTLEHVDDPAGACSEIIRVAKRGFIDVPRGPHDAHFGHREHKWFIDFVEGVLVFRKKPIINRGSPLLGMYALNAYWVDGEVRLMMDYYYRNFGAVQLLWEDKFTYKVIL